MLLLFYWTHSKAAVMVVPSRFYFIRSEQKAGCITRDIRAKRRRPITAAVTLRLLGAKITASPLDAQAKVGRISNITG